MGSFECRDGLTDRIFTLNGIRKYFSDTPLIYDAATGQYQPVPGAGAEITFNPDPASRKWNAEIQQVLTLDHLVEADKLYASLGRKLGAKTYWPYPAAAGAATGAVVGGPVGAALGALVGYVVGKTGGNIMSRLQDKVDYTGDANGNAVYTINSKSLGEVVKAKAKNFGRAVKHKLQKKLYAIAPTRFEDPDDPVYEVPEDHERTFTIGATADPTKYVVTYEANDVPKGLIIKDADRIWQGFVAAQKPRKLFDKLCDFGDWARDRISHAITS